MPGETGAQCGWSDVSAGFWGWGDLNNRRRSRDWALEDKPPALWCPPDKICFMESLDDKRFRLVIFQPSDFQKWDPGPTKENWERMKRNWRAQKLPECLREAENDYKAANDKLMNEASSWGLDMTALRALSILGSMHWDVQKLSGRLALRAAIHAAVKSQVIYLAAAGVAAFGDLFGRMVAHGQARAKAIANCNALYGPRASDPKD